MQPKSTNLSLLIYGGSSSVGSVAIQLAKAAGVFVITTASKRNHRYCKDLGAHIVLDYNDADWILQAASAMQCKTIAGAYDCIQDEATIKACRSVLRKAGKPDGKVIIVGPVPVGVDCVQVFGANMPKEDAVAKAIWTEYLPDALEQRTLVPKPNAQVVGSGLESIQKAMDTLKAGVSAKKIVVSLP